MVIFLMLLCFVLLIIFGGAYFTYRIAFYSPNKQRDAIPSTSGAQYDPYREVMKIIYHQLADRECEDVTITSHDGLILHGRYYHVKDGAPLDIGFHGYRSSPLTDFSGGSELSFHLEHNLLLVDQRAHGKSGGSTITFGILERRDCLNWVHYALERFGSDTQIILYGISMGATTVLMASELELPKNVKGIIADCPYSSPRDIILKVAAGMQIPPKIAYPFVLLAAKIYGGFDLNETTAAEAVRKASVPLLIIHGEADTFVPSEMSEQVFSAAPDKVVRYTFPDAEHGISYLVDSPRYRNIVTEFMEKYLA